MAIAVVACAACLIFLGARQRSLRLEVTALIEGIAQREAELENSQELRRLAEELKLVQDLHDSAVIARLRWCDSREEFVVREGPRIVWCELSSSTPDSKRIGIYVPDGRHWLKFAVGERGRMSDAQLERLRTGDARRIAEVVRWKLGAEADVYELEIRCDANRPLQFSLTGRDNVRTSDHDVPVVQGAAKAPDVVHGSFAFPSELQPDDRFRPYFLETSLPPVIDLALMYWPRRHADIRVWIESDAPACMPAIYVAANYGKITSLRYRHDNPAVIDSVTDADTEFRRLFEPYEPGSQRFIFRQEIFARGAVASN